MFYYLFTFKNLDMKYSNERRIHGMVYYLQYLMINLIDTIVLCSVSGTVASYDFWCFGNPSVIYLFVGNCQLFLMSSTIFILWIGSLVRYKLRPIRCKVNVVFNNIDFLAHCTIKFCEHIWNLDDWHPEEESTYVTDVVEKIQCGVRPNRSCLSEGKVVVDQGNTNHPLIIWAWPNWIIRIVLHLNITNWIARLWDRSVLKMMQSGSNSIETVTICLI